jgi:hypothetical protein
MLPPGPLFHKPKSIIAAINILYATLFLGVIKWVIARLTTDQPILSPVMGIVVVVLTVLIYFFLIRQVGAGRKWARIVLLILFLGGLACYLWAKSPIYKNNLLIDVISLLQAILYIITLVYLFSKDSTNWFNHVATYKKDERVPPSER